MGAGNVINDDDDEGFGGLTSSVPKTKKGKRKKKKSPDDSPKAQTKPLHEEDKLSLFSDYVEEREEKKLRKEWEVKSEDLNSDKPKDFRSKYEIRADKEIEKLNLPQFSEAFSGKYIFELSHKDSGRDVGIEVDFIQNNSAETSDDNQGKYVVRYCDINGLGNDEGVCEGDVLLELNGISVHNYESTEANLNLKKIRKHLRTARPLKLKMYRPASGLAVI